MNRNTAWAALAAATVFTTAAPASALFLGAVFGGSNMGNGGGVPSSPVAAHGFGQSISLTVPPLGCLLLKKRD